MTRRVRDSHRSANKVGENGITSRRLTAISFLRLSSPSSGLSSRQSFASWWLTAHAPHKWDLTDFHKITSSLTFCFPFFAFLPKNKTKVRLRDEWTVEIDILSTGERQSKNKGAMWQESCNRTSGPTKESYYKALLGGSQRVYTTVTSLRRVSTITCYTHTCFSHTTKVYFLVHEVLCYTLLPKVKSCWSRSPVGDCRSLRDFRWVDIRLGQPEQRPWWVRLKSQSEGRNHCPELHAHPGDSTKLEKDNYLSGKTSVWKAHSSPLDCI